MTTPTPPIQGIRIPLATGATAVGNLWWATLLLLTALLSTGLLAALLYGGGGGATPHRALMPLVPVLFFLGSIVFHALALRARASDILLQDGSLRVEGGPHHGARFALADLDQDPCRVETNENAYVEAGSQRTYEQRLVLRLRGGRERVLATSMDWTEQLSFAALQETLKALVRPGPAPVSPVSAASPVSADARVIACPACQAPVAPADAAVVTCAFCGAAVPMRDEVRERLHLGDAERAAQQRVAERVQRLLSRPTAARTNRWLVAALVGKYLLPLALLLAVKLWVFSLAMVWVLGRVVRLGLAQRVVYQRLILDYAALPAAPGQPPLCRRCGGALPHSAAGAVLVRCAYCAAHNLLGVDIHQAARSAERRAAELAGLLLRDQTERARHLAWITLGLATALYGLVRAAHSGS